MYINYLQQIFLLVPREEWIYNVVHYKTSETKNKKLGTVATALQNIKLSKHSLTIKMFGIKMFKRRQEWLKLARIIEMEESNNCIFFLKKTQLHRIGIGIYTRSCALCLFIVIPWRK